jgi:hypothetical protein
MGALNENKACMNYRPKVTIIPAVFFISRASLIFLVILFAFFN